MTKGAVDYIRPHDEANKKGRRSELHQFVVLFHPHYETLAIFNITNDFNWNLLLHVSPLM